MGPLKVYVDSSYRGKDSKCQTGYIYASPYTNKMQKISSVVFMSDNNNDAEIMGVYLAIEDIYNKYHIKDFIIYNDSIIGCAMLKEDTKITPRTFKDHPMLKMIKDYFKEKCITIDIRRLPRKDPMMKKCDKLSKAYRRNNGHK